MTGLLVGLGNVALLIGAGWWPMRAVGGATSRLARVSLAFALGSAIVGLVQFGLTVAGVVTSVAVPALVAAFSLGVSVLGRRRYAAFEDDRHAAPDGPARLCRLAVALVLLAGTAATLGSPFQSDGRTFWGPKARELGVHAASESAMFHDVDRLALHRNYPLLVPALLAPAFAHAPLDAQAGAKVVLAAFVLASLGLLAPLARAGPRAAAPVLALATMPFLARAEVRESATAGGYVDAALALYLLVFVRAVQRLRDREGGGADRLVAAVAAAAAATTKLEGLVAVAIVAIAWALVGPERRSVVAALAGALALAWPSAWFLGSVAPDEPIASLARLADPENWAARCVPVLAGLGGVFVDASRFGLLPWVLLACWPRRGRRAFPTLLVIGILASMTLAYTGTTMHVGRHFYTSAHRLAFQWMPALVWLLAHAAAASRVRSGAGSGAEAVVSDVEVAR